MASFSVFHWLVFFAFIYLVFKALSSIFGGRGKISSDGRLVCPTCGSQGEPKKITKGNLLIEVVLWLCFIVPGVIYTLWRLTTRYDGCPSCGSAGMIPANSPIGKRTIAELSSKQS